MYFCQSQYGYFARISKLKINILILVTVQTQSSVSSQYSRKFHPHDNIFTYFCFTIFATCASLQDTKGKLETYTCKQAHHTDQRSGQISKSIVSGSSFSAVKTISVLKSCHTIMRYKIPCDPSRSGNKLSLTEAFSICWLHENKI